MKQQKILFKTMGEKENCIVTYLMPFLLEEKVGKG